MMGILIILLIFTHRFKYLLNCPENLPLPKFMNLEVLEISISPSIYTTSRIVTDIRISRLNCQSIYQCHNFCPCRSYFWMMGTLMILQICLSTYKRYSNVSYGIETQVTYHILMQLNTYLKTLYTFFFISTKIFVELQHKELDIAQIFF